MTENNYVLSISIPTYGYPEAVKRNVNNLLRMKRDDVEIVVVDNDETGKQIGEYMESIMDPRFHYYRNETNIGRSSNIAMAVKCASADHVLLASSDDSIRIESIPRIVELIKEYPKCGVIMGRCLTDQGNIASCYRGDFRIYKKGYDALMAVPLNGVLSPFVVNKSYLDFDVLLNKKVTYMQNRISKSAAGRGDFIGIEEVIADIVDQNSYGDSVKLECYNCVDWDSEDERAKWDLKGCYYAPKERAIQVIDDIELFESLPLRVSDLVKLVDKRVTEGIELSRRYVALCHNLDSVVNGGFSGFLGYREAFGIFEKELLSHFAEMEKQNHYYYTGRLRDKIRNEIVVLNQAEEIMEDIMNRRTVCVYGKGDRADKLKRVLFCLNVKTVESCMNQLVLIPEKYDSDIEEELQNNGAESVKFMDMMGNYLITVWCDKNRSKDCISFEDLA